MTADRLSPRALNRATLARQLLLDRATLTAGEAVRHLTGLQAQAPLAPYVGLWTRLAGFRQQQLKDLMTERVVVRAHLMRNTVHLVDARDYVRFRPLYQPLLDRDLAGNFGSNLAGVDLAELAAVAAARQLSFLSITAVIGTPMDVTVEELAIESFYPADQPTAAALG